MPPAKPRRIEYMDVDELADAPTNAKDHAARLIESSMTRFRLIETPILDERTGKLIAGHGRRDSLRAMRAEGKEPPEGVTVTKDGRWLTPVTRGWSSKDDLEAEAAGIALNRIGEVGGWKDDELAAALSRISAADPLEGFVGMGYDQSELTSLLDRLKGPHAPGGDTPASSEPVKARVKPGDLWRVGPHLLLCGDCRDAGQVAALLDGRSVNLAVTSPPYAEQREYDESSGFKPIPPDEYVDWFAPVAANVAQHLAPDGSWLVNIKASATGLDTFTYVLDLVLAHVRQWGWHFATEFCWERVGVPKHPGQRLKNQFEPIYQFTRDRWKFNPENVRHASESMIIPLGPGGGGGGWQDKQGQGGEFFKPEQIKKRKDGYTGPANKIQGAVGQPPIGDSIGDGWAYPGNRLPTFAGTHEATGHSAAYPVGLPEFLTRLFTDEGDVVFDPFLGSGSTMLAAHNAGRIAFGIELSAGYCDIALDRMERHAGIDAERVGAVMTNNA